MTSECSDNLDETARSLKLSLFCHYRRAKTSENQRTRVNSEFALSRWLARGSVDFERLRRGERNGFQDRLFQHVAAQCEVQHFIRAPELCGSVERRVKEVIREPQKRLI